MARSSDELKKRTARQLTEALEDRNVKYMVVQQRFTKADDIGQFTIKEFDITK